MPNTAGATAAFDFVTYGNQDSDLATNGEKIDEATATGLTIETTSTMEIDASPTFYSPQLIRAKANNQQPLSFEFNQRSSGIAAGASVNIRLPNSGFTTALPTNGVLHCYFVDLTTNIIIGCRVTRTTSGSYIQYRLTTSKALAVGTTYRAVVTTRWANNGNDGIRFPATAGVYEAVYIAANEKTSFPIEVYPSSFTSLSFTSHITEKQVENLIEVKLSVPSASKISTNEIIVIELPVKMNSTDLFEEDLGLGLYDQADPLCEPYPTGNAPGGLTYSCYFLKGNRALMEPAKIVVHSLSAATEGIYSIRFTCSNRIILQHYTLDSQCRILIPQPPLLFRSPYTLKLRAALSDQKHILTLFLRRSSSLLIVSSAL